MPLSFADAIAAVSAPGQVFEVHEVEVDGVMNRRFANCPRSVREFFEMSRGVDATFIVYEDEEWSFNDVVVASDALGYALVNHFGIRPGDRVAIAMRNLPEWVIAFAAILSIGAVSVSLNAWWREDEIDFALGDCSPALVIADLERVERSVESCARRGVPILAARLGDYPTPPGVERWEDVVVAGRELPEVTIDPDMDATILYTSGTTGSPKGAVSTHEALCQTVVAFGSTVAINEARRGPDEGGSGLDPCFILIVPLFHVTGCIPVMMTCFSWHFKLVMMHRWEPKRALQLIERHRVTLFVGVPTQSWDLLECPDFADFDTSSLISVGGGGAPAPPTLVTRVDRSFARARPQLGYGMTESNAYGPGNYGDDYVSHPTSTGRTPTIVMDVQIRDQASRPLSRNENGEIWLKSPTLIRGYWGRTEDSAETIVDGWLRTGDLGRIDDEGFLYIEDRLKDMILRGGENVFCAEVEAAIYEHPAVHEAAVFAVANERLGEEVACAIELRPGATLTEAELRAYLAARIAAYKIPTRVAFTNEPLPRNAAGKFVKRDMPARYFA